MRVAVDVGVGGWGAAGDREQVEGVQGGGDGGGGRQGE